MGLLHESVGLVTKVITIPNFLTYSTMISYLIAHLLATVKISLVYFQLKTGVFLAGLKIAEDTDIFSWVKKTRIFLAGLKIAEDLDIFSWVKIAEDFKKSSNMAKIWQKMKKSLVELALNPFFR